MNRKESNAEYHRLLNARKWLDLRARKMLANSIANGGWCERCVENYNKRGGVKPRRAVEVHHIVPIESGLTKEAMERLAYDYDNLLAVCKECHAEIHRSMGRWGHKKADIDGIKQQVEDYINTLYGEGEKGDESQQPSELAEG